MLSSMPNANVTSHRPAGMVVRLDDAFPIIGSIVPFLIDEPGKVRAHHQATRYRLTTFSLSSTPNPGWAEGVMNPFSNLSGSTRISLCSGVVLNS
jgi:hypothetical protein